MSSEIRPASTVFLVGIYAVIFALMAAAYLVIEYFFALQMAAIGIVITAAASMTMARNWVMREQTAPNGTRVWTITLLCSIITMIFYGVIGLLGVAADERLLREIQREGPVLMAAVAAILFLISLFVIRIGLWVGIKQAVKQINTAKQKA